MYLLPIAAAILLYLVAGWVFVWLVLRFKIVDLRTTHRLHRAILCWFFLWLPLAVLALALAGWRALVWVVMLAVPKDS